MTQQPHIQPFPPKPLKVRLSLWTAIGSGASLTLAMLFYSVAFSMLAGQASRVQQQRYGTATGFSDEASAGLGFLVAFLQLIPAWAICAIAILGLLKGWPWARKVGMIVAPIGSVIALIHPTLTSTTYLSDVADGGGVAVFAILFALIGIAATIGWMVLAFSPEVKDAYGVGHQATQPAQPGAPEPEPTLPVHHQDQSPQKPLNYQPPQPPSNRTPQEGPGASAERD